MPELIPLEFIKPPGFEGMTVEQFRAKLGDAVGATEEKARRNRGGEGKDFLDVEAIKAKGPDHRPWRATGGDGQSIKPRFASSSKDLLRAAITRMYKFRADYRDALERFRAGDRDVRFPCGTWQMVKVHGANVESCEGSPGRSP